MNGPRFRPVLLGMFLTMSISVPAFSGERRLLFAVPPHAS
jgi:hypothetical protein